MSKKYMQILCILISILLTLSVTANFSTADDSKNEKIVLVENGSSYLDKLKEMNTKIIDKYNNYVLIKISKDRISEYESYGMRIDELKKRATLHVKSHTFDFKEGGPNIEPDLKKKSYKKGTEGLYIVHMLGPINPEWRNTVEEKGVKVINYVPNYAYEVRMTPKQVKEIRDLFFVDWVGIYHPGYKFHDDIKPGLVNINMAPGSSQESLDQINSISQVKAVIGKRGDKCDVRTNVSSIHKIKSIAKLNDVYFISEHNEMKRCSEVDSQLVGGGCHFMDNDDNPDTPYRLSDDKYGAYINQIGYTGKDVTVAVADSGIGDGTTGNAGHPDFEDRVIGGISWDNSQETWNPGEWADENPDEKSHGTHVSGIVAGNAKKGTEVSYEGLNGHYNASMGLAYDSNLYALRFYSTSNMNISNLVEKAKINSDSYIYTISWGGNSGGSYKSYDEAFDENVRDANSNTLENQPMIITVAAGNYGETFNYMEEKWEKDYNSISSPGSAKNVITIGSTESYTPDSHSYGFEYPYEGDLEEVSEDADEPNNIAFKSSRGWTDDNRIKPDLVAPGYSILSTSSPLVEEDQPYTVTDYYEWKSGTSMATPRVAGSSAVTVEWYQDYFGSIPSPAMVKALMINTANDLDDSGNTGSIPNRDEGWGIVDISKLEYPKNDPVPFTVEDQERLLTTGKYEEYKIKKDRNKPLKISLVWTDKEAQPGDDPTLKNDLNLKVISPSGDVYKGNAFSNGWTQKNTDTMSNFNIDSDGYDDVNNVENVYIESPEQGTYKVRVLADNIAADANHDGEYNQDFAIVAYNAKTALDLEIINPPVEGWETFYPDVTVEWEGSLMENNLNSKKVKIEGESWITDLEGYEHHIYEDLPDGWYTVYVKETDRYGNSVTESKSFQVDSN